MARIYVLYRPMSELATKCKTSADKLTAIQGELSDVVFHLDWDVRFQNDINSKANAAIRKTDSLSRALRGFQDYLNGAIEEYRKLDDYKGNNGLSSLEIHTIPYIITGPGHPDRNDYVRDILNKIFGEFGNAGKLYDIINDVFSGEGRKWYNWADTGVDALKFISSVARNYSHYAKIGRAIGSKNAVSGFLLKELGLRNVGRVSTASSPSARFYNNLHNSTSPYNLSDAFGSFTGKNGALASGLAWAGVALSGVANYFGNVEEAKQNGMSNGRVVAETVIETGIETTAGVTATAALGSAVAAYAPAAFATSCPPVLIAAAAGLGLYGINKGVEAWTGQSATEWITDGVIATGEAMYNGAVFVGETFVTGVKAIGQGCQAIGNWVSGLF